MTKNRCLLWPALTGGVIMITAGLPLGAQESRAWEKDEATKAVAFLEGSTSSREDEVPSGVTDDESSAETVATILRPYSSGSRLLMWQPVEARLGEVSLEGLSPALQQRNRAGIPWIVAGSAFVVGGAIVGDDVGTVLMTGGIGLIAYGLFIYF